jgi:hypothetical protein
MCILQLFNFTL